MRSQVLYVYVLYRIVSRISSIRSSFFIDVFTFKFKKSEYLAQPCCYSSSPAERFWPRGHRRLRRLYLLCRGYGVGELAQGRLPGSAHSLAPPLALLLFTLVLGQATR